MNQKLDLKKTYKVFVDENNNLNLQPIVGVKDPEENFQMALSIEAEILGIFESEPGKKYGMLLDLRAFNDGGSLTNKSRKLLFNLSQHPQILGFAIIGGSVVIRTLASVMFKAAGKGDTTQMFAEKEEAEIWIMESIEKWLQQH